MFSLSASCVNGLASSFIILNGAGTSSVTDASTQMSAHNEDSCWGITRNKLKVPRTSTCSLGTSDIPALGESH